MNIAVKKAFPPTVLRANAGTGKTYNLVERFTALIDAGAAPDSILASTFTVKAASEIRDRIMRHLAQRVLQAKGERSDHIARLRAVIDRQHRLQICTLDSFMVAVVAQFSHELGLPSHWRIADEIHEIHLFEQAIHKIIGGGEAAQILTLLREFLRGDYRASIFVTLSARLNGLLTVFEEGQRESWHYNAPDSFSPLSKEEWETTRKEFETYLRMLQTTTSPFKSLIDGLGKINECFAANNFSPVLDGALLRGTFTGNTTYYKRELDSELVELLRKITRGALAEQLATLQRSTISAAALLDALHSILSSARKTTGLFSFDALKNFAHLTLSSTALEEIYFRLDATVQHLLLDEFQDTSFAQWQMLHPIAGEIMAQSGLERSFFCVGDVKQAIYGWRGGVAEIFDSLNETWPQLEQRSLNRTYRSAPEIVAFLNQVFSTIEHNEALASYGEVVKKWAARFEQHESTVTDRGYVRLEILPPTEEDLEVPLEARVRQLIERILNAHPDASIGILVRSNSSAAALVNFLRNQNLPYTISEEGGSTLVENHGVLSVVALLQAIAHPSDSVARFHVSNCLLGTFLGLSETTTSFEFSQCVHRIGLRIEQEGLGRVVARLIEMLYPFARPKEARRLQSLTNLAIEFEQSGAVGLEDFLTLVKARKVEDVRPASVRIMTVHKSKGLEFDAVILPDIDFNMVDVTREAALRFRPNPLAPPTQCVLYPNEMLRLADPNLDALHKSAQATSLKESLSLLYVALTRARFGLFLLSTKIHDPHKPPTWSGIIQLAVGLKPDANSKKKNEALHWHSGGWDKREAASESRIVPFAPPTGGNPRRSLHFQKGRALSSFLDLSKGIETSTLNAFLESGSIHEKEALYRALLRSITWSEEVLPDEKELLEYSPHLSLTRAERAQTVRDFIEFLPTVKTHPVFSKELLQKVYKSETFEIFQNLPFLVPAHDTTSILRGAFLRAVIVREERVVAAHVLVDARHAKPSDLSRCYEQAALYRYAAARLFGISEEVVQVYYLFVKDKEIYSPEPRVFLSTSSGQASAP